MFATFMASRWFKPVVYAATAAALMVGIWLYGERQEAKGYHRADLECQVRIADLQLQQLELRQAEQLRQLQANQAAKKRETELINQLDRNSDEIEELLREQAIEAAKDTDGDRICIGSHGVQRINRIR